MRIPLMLGCGVVLATVAAEIERLAIVFKDGVGYDPGKLLASVRGRYGEY